MRDFGRPGYEHELLADDAAGLRAVFDGGSGVDVEHVLARLGTPEVLRHCLDWYAAQTLEDATGLGPVTAPTLHVWSDGDRALGAAGAEATGRFVDGPYRFEVLRGVSHWVPEQAPDRLGSLLQEHLCTYPG
jgi:pimeloyl-ACP methyl ester carboxylesterase